MSSTTSTGRPIRPELDADTRFTAGTPVGIDVGLRNALVLAPATDDPEIEEAHVVNADHLRDYYKVLQHRHASGFEEGQVDAALFKQLHGIVEDVATEALAYVETFEMPVLVLEDLDYSEPCLDGAMAAGVTADCWFFPAVHEQLTEQARGENVPVVKTNPRYSTKQCHICGELGTVDFGEFDCPTDDCPVDRVCRDRSAAATIANRVL